MMLNIFKRIRQETKKKRKECEHKQLQKGRKMTVSKVVRERQTDGGGNRESVK